jgi:hypothetical protein
MAYAADRRPHSGNTIKKGKKMMRSPIPTADEAAYRMLDRLGRASEYGQVVSPRNSSHMLSTSGTRKNPEKTS